MSQPPLLPKAPPTPLPTAPPQSVPVAAPAPSTAQAAQAARLAQLFRASSRAGLIHPLQHLLQRYRAEQAQP